MTTESALTASLYLFAFNMAIQSLENAAIKSNPRSLRLFNIFCFLIVATLFISPNLYALALINICLWLTSIHWRGRFNGGSDSISILTGLALLFAYSGEDQQIQTYAVFFIGAQATLSYFIAGALKLRVKEWRRGAAVEAFFDSARFPRGPKMVEYLRDYRLLAGATYSVLAFEILFPLSLLHPSISIAFLVFGTFFHLSVFWLVGLNRFFWSWLSTYPSLLYISFCLSDIN